MESRDSVIIRVTSPRSGQKTFSGVITLQNARSERRLDKVTTPFEIRLPAQDIDAQFTADDMEGLSGELISLKGDGQEGRVYGTVDAGAVRLHFEPGKSFGFGRRLDKRTTLF
ncbi:MAG: hypothetical protein WD801_00645 [Gemmatimonadaceae bacterium]